MKKLLYVLSCMILLHAVIFIQTCIGQNYSGDNYINSAISDRPSDQNYCSARLQDNVLILENSKMSRTYKWNNGNIITLSVTNKQNGKVWKSNASSPDISFPGQQDEAGNPAFSVKSIMSGPFIQAHLEAEIICSLGELEVKRVFKIYPACPAIACDFYLRGKANCHWTDKPDNKGLPYPSPVMEKLELSGKHWKIAAIEFFDVTDRTNTLVRTVTALSYRGNIFKGNL